MAAFWAGIRVEDTQEAGVVPRCKRAANEILPFQSPHMTRRETVGVFYLCPQRVGWGLSCSLEKGAQGKGENQKVTCYAVQKAEVQPSGEGEAEEQFRTCAAVH